MNVRQLLFILNSNKRWRQSKHKWRKYTHPACNDSELKDLASRGLGNVFFCILDRLDTVKRIWYYLDIPGMIDLTDVNR